eukprot:m.73727 g.73727  ORF g.73727 m.73727 type:complete len:77 (+) comp24589_c0_seq1:677-907(+)
MDCRTKSPIAFLYNLSAWGPSSFGGNAVLGNKHSTSSIVAGRNIVIWQFSRETWEQLHAQTCTIADEGSTPSLDVC